jgi:alpha-glucosidase
MLADPASILNLYRALFALRKSSQALQVGSYNTVNTPCEDCFAYQRQTEKERYLVTLNFSSAERTLSLADGSKARCILSTHLDRNGEVGLGHISLRPYEGLILKL